MRSRTPRPPPPLPRTLHTVRMRRVAEMIGWRVTVLLSQYETLVEWLGDEMQAVSR